MLSPQVFLQPYFTFMRPISTRLLLVCAVVVFTMGHSSRGMGASKWVGGDGLFTDGGNWEPRGVPALQESVEIGSGKVQWRDTISGFAERGAGSLVEGGEWEIQSSFRNAVDGEATLEVRDGTIEHEGNFFVMSHNQPGRVVMSGGSIRTQIRTGLLSSDLGNSRSEFILENGEFEAMFVPDSPHAIRFQAILGKAGNDRWTIAGGRLTLDAGKHGFQEEDFFAGEMDEEVDRRTRAFLVRRSSVVEISGGEVIFRGPQFLALGYRTDGLAELALAGGSFSVLDASPFPAAMVVGFGAEGFVSVSDGEMRLGCEPGHGADSTALLLGYDGGRGEFEQTGGVVDASGFDIVVGGCAGSVGIYRMRGGELRARSLRQDSTSNKTVFEFTGGKIILEGDQRSLAKEGILQTGTGNVAADFDPREQKTTFTLR